jgi:hypothetical protein
MILVTGTKRSGTSLWMQILKAAGYPVIGAPFLGAWEQSIGAANPRGFYESPLRQGIFYATNPHPETGAFLAPADTRRHAVKVFIPGLTRSDLAYMDKVVATLRHWRDYGPSLARLLAMEDAYLASAPSPEAAAQLERRRRWRSQRPAAVEWWFENSDLVRDVATRGYPINFSTFDRLLEDPEPLIHKVLTWLGGGDLAAAAAAVDPALRSTRADRGAAHDLEPGHAEVMDELCDHIHRERPLTPALLEAMNRVQAELEARWGTLSRERAREDTASEDTASEDAVRENTARGPVTTPDRS